MRAGHKRVLIQAATGAGKTVLIAQMLAQASAKGSRSWFVVHRTELLEQSVETFILSAGIHTGIIAAGFSETPLAPVQVCAVQSLARRQARFAPPDLLVFDEAHHQAAVSWAKVAASFPAAYQIGLTATPQRLDRRGLKAYFDDLLCGPSTADLIRDGYLAPYTLFAPTVAGPALDGVGTVAGDYNKKALRIAMDNSTIVGDAVQYYHEHSPTARALVFMWSVESSEQIAQRFREAGIPAEHIDGETSRVERQARMARFRAGETRVICNVDLFGEGLDVPAVDAVFLCRPTQSLGLYLQQVGRGLRMSPGKTAVKIFDHAGNWTRHGLPDAARVWTLEDTPKKKKVEPTGRRCLKCHAVSRAGAEMCAVCGTPFEVKPRQVQKVSGTLAEWRAMSYTPTRADATARHEYPRGSLAYWRAEAKRGGYKPGWAYIRHRDEQLKRLGRHAEDL